MTKFTVITDLHIGSAHQTMNSFYGTFQDNVIFLGDNFDFKGCLKKDIELLRLEFKELMRLNPDLPFLASNHEGEWGLPSIYKTGNTLFTHGHLCKKNSDKYIKDASTQWKGTNFFLWYLKGLVNKAIHMVGFQKDDALRACELAKMHGCSAIVMGHYHLPKIYDENVNGVRVIVLPRGITTIELGG